MSIPYGQDNPDAEQWADVDGAVHDQPLAGRRVRSRPVSAIKLKRRQWLWDDRVPLGEVTLWVGHAGIGKSQAAVWLAAQVSRGELPGELHGTPSPVLYLGTEDDWSHTLAPRFVSADAKLDNVHQLYAETHDGAETGLSLSVDLDSLREEIAATDARLVVFDALLSTFGSAKLTEQGTVRRHLEPLAQLAQELNIAVIGVAHFRKASDPNPLHMIAGSAEFGQVVRSAIGFARDSEQDDGSAVMSLVKTNISPQGTPSIRYRIEPAAVETEDGPTDVGRFVSLGETEQDIRDLLNIEPGQREDPEDAEDARGWLRAYLVKNGGEAAPEDVHKAGRAAGYSPDQLKRAKRPKASDRDQNRVRSEKRGDTWVWTLEAP